MNESNEGLEQNPTPKEEKKGIDKIDLKKLNFEEFKKLYWETVELAGRSFFKTENGYETPSGDQIVIEKDEKEEDKYAVELYFYSEDMAEEFSHAMISNEIFSRKKTDNKEKLMQAIKELLEKLKEKFGFRIIE